MHHASCHATCVALFAALQVQRPPWFVHIRLPIQKHLLQSGASNRTASSLGVHMAQPVGHVLAAHPAAGTCWAVELRCPGAGAAAILPHVLWGMGGFQLRE
jgi:hypothetical protein